LTDLPHEYPFRFVEPRPGIREGAGPGPLIAPSVDASLPRSVDEAGYPLTLALEAMAQSVLADPPGAEGEEPGSAPGGRAHLAGIEDARLLSEIRPGDRLEGRSELQARFGPALKVRCELLRDGEPVAEATLLLTMTD
jgi:3-hydroxymyristoyl/3-hydroxydecanoyl-(acyl carrier protein) dehydratase